jgi:hypothetical protein
MKAALQLALGLLWFTASAGSALLVYWLYISPAYGIPWSAGPGALLFAALSFYAGVGFLASLIDMARGR